MANRRPYERKSTVLLSWALKAVGLVIASATLMAVALTISRAVSVKPDSPRGGKFVGVRHEATTLPPAGNTATASASSGGQEQELSSDTIVRNGVTVVSPQLLVPVIDIASIQTAIGSEGQASSSNVSNARKRSGNANRSQSRSRKQNSASHWEAYGLVLR